MKPTIASRLTRNRLSKNRAPAVWQWPRELRSGEVSPDTRLLCPEIAGFSARLHFSDESVVVADVRSVSNHDIVLKVSDPGQVPVLGQIVEVTISHEGQILLDDQKSVLHWSGIVSKCGIVALFTINPTGEAFKPFIGTDARGEIRFPVELPATVETQSGRKLAGRIVDYSLSGCRFICDEPLALDCEYHTIVKMGHSSVDVALRPRWATKGGGGYQMGCTFRSEEGVLLACRHQKDATADTGLMRPLSNNWKPLA